jgi:peptide-methionine (S)-S-oxide reductase
MCSQENKSTIPQLNMATRDTTTTVDTATYGAGCFWCVEAVFQRLSGVLSVTSGYSGGDMQNPTYEDVCTGETGHAEVCQIVYDPKRISYEELLEVFWSSHDPTSLNQQGADVGTQYRSAIFYHNERQKEIAEQYKKKLNDEHVFGQNVVTEIAPFGKFYPADKYHQNYYNQNTDKPYCSVVIRPKVEKIEKIFKSKLKH